MRPNVLLVVLDTVRAQNMGVYGHANDTTPFLDQLSNTRATVFEQARAPAARSLDSHVSILTGLHAEEHQVTRQTDRLAQGHTVFEWLADEHGYRTGVFSENSWLTEVDAGIKDAFGTVEGPRNLPFPDAVDPTRFVVEHGQGAYRAFFRHCLRSDAPVRSLVNGLAIKIGSDYPSFLPGRTSTRAGVYVDAFLEWAQEGEGPWAACVNLMDAHHPYEPEDNHDRWGGDRLRALQDDIEDVKWEFNGGHRPWWQRRALEALYDGTIRQVDAALERLLTTLADEDALEDTLVVVTSDHGEGFGEPSRIRPGIRVASHSVSIHEALFHVPLLVKAPGQTAADRVTAPASLTGFPDAVRRAVGGDGDPATGFVPDGPVLATAFGLDDPVQERARRYCSNIDAYTGRCRAVYEADGEGVRKSITWRDQAVTVQVRDAQTAYTIDTPPESVESRVGAAFDDLYDAGVAETGGGVETLSEDTHQRLEELGYV